MCLQRLTQYHITHDTDFHSLKKYNIKAKLIDGEKV